MGGYGSQGPSSQNIGGSQGYGGQGFEPQQSASGMYGGQQSGGTWGGQMGGGYGSSTYGGRSGQRSSIRRGPKGYERSDERLKEDICERMYTSTECDTSEVSVDVKSGVVTFEGTVEDRRSKYMLEEMVDNVPGVKDVDNRLRIQRGDGSSTQGGGSSPSSSGSSTYGRTGSGMSSSGTSGTSDSSSAGGRSSHGESGTSSSSKRS
jgi:hypothetical protein